MKLFYDDEFDALQQMVARSDKTPKEVASFLRPDLKPESAYAWFKACCNPHGDQRFKFGQIVAAMNYCGQFDPLYYAADETSHDRPKAVTKETELARLLRAWDDHRREQAKLEPKIERLRSAA